MRKLILSLLVLLLLTSNVFAEVHIAEEHRVKNWWPGYCAWVSLETIGRHMGITQLHDLGFNRMTQDSDYESGWQVYPRNVGYIPAIRQKLDRLGVKYKITTWDRDALRKASNANGCVIFVRPCLQEIVTTNPDGKKTVTYFGWRSCHALILTHYDDKKIHYIDPNTCRDYFADMWCDKPWLDTFWEGTAITIEK